MKRILTILAIAISIFTMSLSWGGLQPVLADIAEGEKIFNNNCAACHAGGLNRVVAAKTLKLAALEKYGMNSVEAITTQVTKGKGAMPAFGKKLSAEEINTIANYVLERAEQGWKKA